MKEEILDIVDESDNVIGQMPFREAHDKGVLHRFSRILLMNSKGDFVLHICSANTVGDAGKIDAPGGHLSAGETYTEAAVREMQEEMGVVISEGDLAELGYIEDKRPGIDNMIGKAYVAIHDGPYTLQEEELEEIQIFTPEAILNKAKNEPELFSPKLLQTLKLWEKHNA